jgi:hypothetical protein
MLVLVDERFIFAKKGGSMGQEDEVPNGSLLSLQEFAMNRSTAPNAACYTAANPHW